ncbi:MAG: TonB-dependent receptor [Novosphingobium sp.]|nr:TonB-dependent receptor [Novosphingobium sp.]MBO9601555.1 TonB-dependent receptor [Novosphingobium sp.]
MRVLRTLLCLGAAALAAAPALAQDDDDSTDNAGDIVVLGSRIPRAQIEGPAPVTTITSDDILKNGYQSVPDVLRAMNQNGGETQSQQSFAGADFTPGAQQVDLRGLGPSHTLVLVNGRRIADFPLPYNGNSNFTDISNIPIGLIDNIQVLSGSASAIYGSDAISGVVNFQLKQKTDGTRLDVRYGATEHGGGQSYRITLTSGFESGGFHAVFGGEVLGQAPVWDYQRSRQDSTADNPTTPDPVARRNFLRTDEYNDYLDPGAATCAPLAYLNEGTTYYGSRPDYGFDLDTYEYVDGHYCGTDKGIAYGTMISDRRAVSLYSSIGYDVSDSLQFFVDAQFSYSKLKLFKDVLDWFYVAPDGNEEGTFYNPKYLAPKDTYSGDSLDNWYRLFTPEEMGGFENGMTRNRSITYNVTPGIKGKLGDKWNYEVSFNRAEYSSKVEFPEVIIDKANAFFLGQEIADPDNDTGYARFDANPARLYTPLTPEEYKSITAYSVYHPKSWTNNFSATVNTTSLFQLPAGPVGFAAVAEIGNQGYDLRPDPLALTQYYVGLVDSDGKGKRTHWGAGGELRVPAFEFLELSGAGRYDHYSFAGNGIGKFTYNIGAELRPASTLLLRGAYGTGFRAPDLHYVFRGPGNTHTGGTDYYTCRTEESSPSLSDCADDYDADFINHKTGNTALKAETARSLNAGVVYQPFRNFDFSVDYFRVSMKNQVLDLNIDSVLRDEADCRLGENINGTPVDVNSPTCVDALARVERYASGALAGQIQAVNVMPINVAREMTDGIDVAAHLKLPTAHAGTFSASLGYTYVFKHTIQQYPGDPVVNKLAYDSDYDIPRDKGTASITWDIGKFTTTLTGQRLGKLPNWDEDRYIKASYLFNLSAQYAINDRLQLSGTIDNLFDKGPAYDPSYASYPYYDISWFDGVGRSFYLQLSWKIGGQPL